MKFRIRSTAFGDLVRLERKGWFGWLYMDTFATVEAAQAFLDRLQRQLQLESRAEVLHEREFDHKGQNINHYGDDVGRHF